MPHQPARRHGQLTGQSIRRREDIDLLTGHARFVADVDEAVLVNPAFVAFVRSPYARAAITAVDTAEAMAAAGVLAVVAGGDLAHLVRGAFSYTDEPAGQQPVLATGHVGFVGEPVVAVVAETEAEAAEATELVVVDYEPLTPVLDVWDALAQGLVVTGTSLPADHDRSRFDGCDVVVTQRFVNPRQSPAPIEPRAMACGWRKAHHLHVWAATQRPHGFKDSLATTYGLPPDQIHVTAPAVGGGFGGKVSRTSEEHLLPELARMVGRPVRWNETRSEYFASATQGRGEHLSVTLAGGGDGRFEAIRVELVKDAGAYPSVGSILAASYGRAAATGVYAIPHAEFDSVAVMTNLPPTSAFRGAGRAPIVAAIERTVDLYAAAGGLDPAEVRRTNLVVKDSMPYRTATGALLDEADYPASLDQALAAAGYDELRRQQAERRASGSPVELGIGIGCYNHMTVGHGGEEATVEVKPDGTAVVTTGSTSQGHGHATTWAQIAGDILGMPLERVIVVEGSTDAISTGQGAVASRSAQTAGVAVHRLSTELVDRARLLAADHLEASPSDLVIATDGEPGFQVIGTPSAAVSWATLASIGLDTERELSCGEYYDAAGRVSFPSGCHIAVVEVDTETGGVSLRRLVAADDAGPRLNPMIVAGQLHGGIASGVAQVLGEVMAYDGNGTPVTANFTDYAIGTIDWFPSFELVTDPPEVPSGVNQLGVKGVGESGTVGATPAVHNAILDALAPRGVTHIDLPCTSLRIWEALGQAKHRTSRRP